MDTVERNLGKPEQVPALFIGRHACHSLTETVLPTALSSTGFNPPAGLSDVPPSVRVSDPVQITEGTAKMPTVEYFWLLAGNRPEGPRGVQSRMGDCVAQVSEEKVEDVAAGFAESFQRRCCRLCYVPVFIMPS